MLPQNHCNITILRCKALLYTVLLFKEFSYLNFAFPLFLSLVIYEKYYTLKPNLSTLSFKESLIRIYSSI